MIFKGFPFWPRQQETYSGTAVKIVPLTIKGVRHDKSSKSRPRTIITRRVIIYGSLAFQDFHPLSIIINNKTERIAACADKTCP